MTAGNPCLDVDRRVKVWRSAGVIVTANGKVDVLIGRRDGGRTASEVVATRQLAEYAIEQNHGWMFMSNYVVTA